MVTFDTLVDTQLHQMKLDQDMLHGQSSRWGRTLNRHTEEEEDLTRGRMSMHRVCVYHVGQDHVSKSAAICGEIHCNDVLGVHVFSS